MEKITFTCETITPMFMAGANGITPELRAPSIKGVMRFWWRAMHGDLELEDLKRKEAKIFGGSGEKESRSNVIIKILNQKIIKTRNIKSSYSLKWDFDKIHRTIIPEKNKLGKITRDHTGIGYLLYSTVFPNKEKEFIKEKGTFDITFLSLSKEHLKQASASFWCSIYLGGFGSRSRRGGGDITIISQNDPNNIFENIKIDFIPKSKEPNELENWIVENFHTAQKIILDGKERPDNFINEYSNLGFSRFILCKESKDNWIDALNEIGKIYKEFRDTHRKEKIKVATLGLPAQVFVKYKNEKIERRSSPLILKIIKSNNKYFWLALRLCGEFLPQGVKLEKNSDKKNPDYDLIDEFWKNIEDKFRKQVILSEPDLLVKIKKKIISQIDPDKIIFFGSKARGNFHRGSDIDLAIEPGIISPGSLELNGAIDLINLKRNSDIALKNKIHKEGVVIYERQN